MVKEQRGEQDPPIDMYNTQTANEKSHHMRAIRGTC